MNRVQRETPVDRLRDQAATVGKDLRDLGTMTGEAVRDSATGYVAQGRERIEKLGTRMNDYVTERPMKSLLLAAGAGALLGYLLHRRR